MHTDDTGRVVDDLLSRLANADWARAYQNDAAFHLQTHVIRTVLAAALRAMEHEGVPEETRLRVARAVVTGTPDADDAESALARVDEHRKLAIELSQRPLDVTAFLGAADGRASRDA